MGVRLRGKALWGMCQQGKYKNEREREKERHESNHQWQNGRKQTMLVLGIGARIGKGWVALKDRC
jgi:hypothetical protein